VLTALATDAAEAAGAQVTRAGTYVAIEGPSFSSRAESRLYRAWGCDVVGMTALPEAKLAREAELPYALIGMVTDWDSWRADAAGVEASEVLAQVAANAGTARHLVERLAQALPPERSAAPADTALDGAVVTAREARDRAVLARLDAVCRGWLQRGSA
jgi:5'-methylthioadenosine phosphorylase